MFGVRRFDSAGGLSPDEGWVNSMQRRNVLRLIGAIGGGSAVVTGTSAFSNVEANRNVSVEVVGDASALLSIAPSEGPNGAYATGADDGTVSLDFTDSNDNVDGDGINQDAVSLFDEVFVIENQGTQEVELSVSPLSFAEFGSGLLLVVLVPLDISNFAGTLGVGDAVRFSAAIASVSGGSQSGLSLSDELQITAEAS